MRKKDRESHTELMHIIKSIIDKTKKVENNLRATIRIYYYFGKNVSKQQGSL